MATRKIKAVNFDFISGEECEIELKSHKSSFPIFAGFNNRTSRWMTHPKRKPVYEIIPRLIFATWNESLRLDNDCCEVKVRSRCNEIFEKYFRRKVQDLEFVKILKGFKRIHSEFLQRYKAN
ncbi:hypothetical protein [Pseudomonas ficuserectae]|uniref:hypothetical protein n=1 Tax=Pseudomonas ficuserectae TaxID=53410 RepID=UPI000ABF34C5|nr:hypothetical protein [Pseudomonas ficuserectae]